MQAPGNVKTNAVACFNVNPPPCFGKGTLVTCSAWAGMGVCNMHEYDCRVQAGLQQPCTKHHDCSWVCNALNGINLRGYIAEARAGCRS
eukprot:scaffold115313_cov57-Phaeocystis_antarctica.AAC.2